MTRHFQGTRHFALTADLAVAPLTAPWLAMADGVHIGLPGDRATQKAFTGSPGNDVRTGTGHADTFDMTQGGKDTVRGRGGDDIINFGDTFRANDTVNGGNGLDRLELNGDYSAGVTFAPHTLKNVEIIDLSGDFNYTLTLDDANVAAGKVLRIDTDLANETDHIIFDGSHETDGSFIVLGSAGPDVLTGGDGPDSFIGYGGADRLTGGSGPDSYNYPNVTDSISKRYDTIVGFDFASVDTFDLPVAVAGINAKVHHGKLTTGRFDAQLASKIDGTHLFPHHAVIYTPNAGNLAGTIFLIVDQNGTPGYQANEDMVFALENPAHLSHLDKFDFTS